MISTLLFVLALVIRNSLAVERTHRTGSGEKLGCRAALLDVESVNGEQAIHESPGFNTLPPLCLVHKHTRCLPSSTSIELLHHANWAIPSMLYTPIIRRKLSSTLRNGQAMCRGGRMWFPFENTVENGARRGKNFANIEYLLSILKEWNKSNGLKSMTKNYNRRMTSPLSFHDWSIFQS